MPQSRCQDHEVMRRVGSSVTCRQLLTWPLMDTAMPSPVRLIRISLGAILVARPALLISSSTSSPLWGHMDVSARPESSARRSSAGASFTQGVMRTSPEKAPDTSTRICRGAFFSAHETRRIVARAQKNAQLGSVQFVDPRDRLRGTPASRGREPTNFAFKKKKVRAVNEGKVPVLIVEVRKGWHFLRCPKVCPGFVPLSVHIRTPTTWDRRSQRLWAPHPRRGSYPGHRSTGRGGYFAKLLSVSERSHK